MIIGDWVSVIDPYWRSLQEVIWLGASGNLDLGNNRTGFYISDWVSIIGDWILIIGDWVSEIDPYWWSLQGPEEAVWLEASGNLEEITALGA